MWTYWRDGRPAVGWLREYSASKSVSADADLHLPRLLDISNRPIPVALQRDLLGAAALVIPSVAVRPDLPPSLSVIGVMLVLGLGCTGMTLVLFYTLIAQIGPARAALGFYLSPVFAVLFGVIFLGETLDASAGMGLTAIIIGSVLASRVPTSGKNRWAGQR